MVPRDLDLGERGAEIPTGLYSYRECAVGFWRVPDSITAGINALTLSLPEHSEAADRIANRSTHEDIRQEVNIEREP